MSKKREKEKEKEKKKEKDRLIIEAAASVVLRANKREGVPLWRIVNYQAASCSRLSVLLQRFLRRSPLVPLGIGKLMNQRQNQPCYECFSALFLRSISYRDSPVVAIICSDANWASPFVYSRQYVVRVHCFCGNNFPTSER